MGFKITLAGDQGSGKSTVAKLLLEALGAEYYSTGSYARAYATRLGMDIEHFNIYSETHPEIDYEIDHSLEQLNGDERSLVVDSRMAWHFVEGGFDIFLFTDPREAARRIFAAGRATESYPTQEAALVGIRARRDSEIKRYRDLYDVNIKDPDNYALLVDTTFATPEQECEVILDAFRRWQADPAYRVRYICPAHLCFADDAPDGDEVSRLVALAERGEPLPAVEVRTDGVDYYVERRGEAALAAALCERPYVPFVILPGAPDPARHFVKLENLGLC